MHLAADEHARSSESLVDSDTRLKHLIEDKYMGRLSQWQMSYVCRPDVQQSEPRIDSELSPYRSYLRRRQLHTCRRSGSVSEELEQTLMRQSHSYWYTNVKLKNKAKPSQSPQRLVEDLKQKLKNNATKFKVFFGESKLPQKEPAEKPQQNDIISYYREKYEANTSGDVRATSQQSFAKRRNLPRLTPAKPLETTLKIDPW